MNTTDEMMNTTEEMEDEVMSEETTDLVEYEDEDEEPSDGAVALTVLGILGAGAAIGAAGKTIFDKIKAGKKPKQYNPEKPTFRQWLAIHLAPELYYQNINEFVDTPFEDATDETIEVEAEVQETPKEENEEVAEETTETKKNNKKK
jgi:hypothetical protein